MKNLEFEKDRKTENKIIKDISDLFRLKRENKKKKKK